MTALVTGALGQLGQELRSFLKEEETCWTDIGPSEALSILRIDVTDKASVNSLVESVKPTVIFHCAAYTDVEGTEVNKEAAQAVNVEGSRNMALAAKRVNAKLVTISTDYVFDGTKNFPYKEDDEPHPLSQYGKTKLDGERVALDAWEETFVVRTAWLYGPRGRSTLSTNFPQKMKELAKNHPELTIINDQIGSPTFTKDLAEALIKLSRTELFGRWHIVNTGEASWYDLACEILKEEIAGGLEVRPIPSSQFSQIAERPKYSVLDTTKYAKAFGPLRPWQAALADYQAATLATDVSTGYPGGEPVQESSR